MSAAPTLNEARPRAGRDRWRSRALTGSLLRTVVRIGPTVLATVVVIVALQTLPTPADNTAATSRVLGIGLVGFGVAAMTARYAARFLPLAALLKLSLVFPDAAPSRFRLAVAAGSSRRLAREAEAARSHGLSDDQSGAAEQILLLSTALGEHDRRTRGHSERVRIYSRLIGEQMRIGGDDLEKLQWGALLHDLGKISVPSHILNLPDRPSDDEWRLVQQHPGAGRRLIQPVAEFLGPWAAAADGHHEKWEPRRRQRTSHIECAFGTS